MLIVIEGPDGCGKTTQAKMLADKLGATYQPFPDRSTPVGMIIDKWLKREVGALLSLDAKCQEHFGALMLQALMTVNRFEVLPVLAQTRPHVVCDRYWQSAMIYGAVIDTLDPAWVKRINASLPQADVNVLIDTPARVLAQRLKARGGNPERYEKPELLERCATAYRALWEVGANGGQWVVIDGDREPAEVHRDIMRAVLGPGT